MPMKHDEKQCTKCKTVKSSSEFSERKEAADGLRSWCKACSNSPKKQAQSRAWYEKNRPAQLKKQRAYYRSHRDEALSQQAQRYATDEQFREAKKLRERARKVGLSLEEYTRVYDILLELQAGCCAICGVHVSQKQLVMDHRHSDMLVRGLLCSHCNTCIGMAFDSPESLRRAADYIEEY